MPASREQLTEFFAKDFPQTKCQIVSVEQGSAVVTHPVDHEFKYQFSEAPPTV